MRVTLPTRNGHRLPWEGQVQALRDVVTARLARMAEPLR